LEYLEIKIGEYFKIQLLHNINVKLLPNYSLMVQLGSQKVVPPWKVIVKTFAMEDLSFIL